jgi:hypothetical protein
MFAAPVTATEGNLVVRPEIVDYTQLKGKKLAIRGSGRPFSTMLRLRLMGLDGQVETEIVPDRDVGRWGQWKKLVSGECDATFISSLYLKEAVGAGLKALPAPQLPAVGQFLHVATAAWAKAHDAVMDRYARALVHGVCLLKLRRKEALEIVEAGESAKLLAEVRGITDQTERAYWVDSIAAAMQIKPYPTPEAIANTYMIANDEWPMEKDINPLSLWDLHWVKQIDDEGFIDDLVAEMSR